MVTSFCFRLPPQGLAPVELSDFKVDVEMSATLLN
jgi:hypothetical protein